jgi:hypothetical protein
MPKLAVIGRCATTVCSMERRIRSHTGTAFFGFGAAQDNDEFFTAIARHVIGVARAVLETGGDIFQTSSPAGWPKSSL